MHPSVKHPWHTHPHIVAGVPPASRGPHHHSMTVPEVVRVLAGIDVAVVVRGRPEAASPAVPPRPGVGVGGAGVGPVPILLAGERL